MKRIDQSARPARPFPVPPSSLEYKAALEAIGPRVTELQLSILRAHYAAPNHTATAHELGDQCGMGYRTVNSQYGNLAKRLLEEMGYAKPESEDGKLWLTGICVWPGGMKMIMRPELAQALRDLGWV